MLMEDTILPHAPRRRPLRTFFFSSTTHPRMALAYCRNEVHGRVVLQLQRSPGLGGCDTWLWLAMRSWLNNQPANQEGDGSEDSCPASLSQCFGTPWSESAVSCLSSAAAVMMMIVCAHCLVFGAGRNPVPLRRCANTRDTPVRVCGS